MSESFVFNELRNTILVDEVLESTAGYANGPERSLLCALLFDGVYAYINHIESETREGQQRFAEASAWIFNADESYVFSFQNVCEGLGVSPEYLRLGLNNVATSSQIGRVRRRME